MIFNFLAALQVILNVQGIICFLYGVPGVHRLYALFLEVQRLSLKQLLARISSVSVTLLFMP